MKERISTFKTGIIKMDIRELKTALNNYFQSLNKLKELGITTNKKDFTSQIGEWLVAEIFSGKRAVSGIQKYWDIEAQFGKIQVKTHSKSITTNARWSAIKYDIDANVDFVVIIVFSEDYILNEFFKIPWKDCLNLIRRNKDRDVLMWNHLKDFKIELTQLPKQEIISIFTNK
jgi:hypothetical protein